MAWRSHGTTNATLISSLTRNSLITSPAVASAMQLIDRAHFVPDPATAYRDSPQSIGHGATISAPHMHAAAAEALVGFLGKGRRVLDVGSGSGFLVGVLGGLVFGSDVPSTTTTSEGVSGDGGEHGVGDGAKQGLVVGVEHIEALRALGERNLGKSEIGRKWLESGRVRFVLGDGRKGWREEGGEEGWDVIHVGAAAAGFQQELVDQLKSPGRLFIPIEENGEQHIYIIDKDEQGNVTTKKQYGVRYVPLTDAPVGT